MQEGKQSTITNMPPNNPTKTSDRTTSFDDQKGLKKSKSEGVIITHQSAGHVRAAAGSTAGTKSEGTVEDCMSGRERLKRHRVEVAGRVWVPDMWGQENLLKDWIDCTASDFSLANSSIMSARASMMEQARSLRSANNTRLRLENSC